MTKRVAKRRQRPAPARAPAKPTLPPHVCREIVIKARLSYLDKNGMVTKSEWTPELPLAEAAFFPELRTYLTKLGVTVTPVTDATTTKE